MNDLTGLVCNNHDCHRTFKLKAHLARHQLSCKNQNLPHNGVNLLCDLGNSSMSEEDMVVQARESSNEKVKWGKLMHTQLFIFIFEFSI